jgi:hypothetical protein
MAVYEFVLAPILTDALKTQTSVFYHSEVEEAKIIGDYVSRYASPKKYTILSEEGDMEAMDTGVSEELSLDVLLDVVHRLPDSAFSRSDVSERDYLLYIRRAIKFFFHSPVIDLSGAVVWGLWNLLSGLGITNGIENLINARQQLAVVAGVEREVQVRIPHARVIDFLLRVMGDDSALLMTIVSNDGSNVRSLTESEKACVHEIFVDCFERVTIINGLRINRLKQRSSEDTVFFCKRLFALRSTRGFKQVTVKGERLPVFLPVYCIEFVLNSIARPESDLPYDPITIEFDGGKTSVTELVRTCERLDNAKGDPLWSTTVTMLAELFRFTNVEELVSALEKNHYVPSSWRKKVYGEKEWELASSPSLRLCIEKLAAPHGSDMPYLMRLGIVKPVKEPSEGL